MNTRIFSVSEMCEQAIVRVDRAIENHMIGLPDDLSIQLLHLVRTELTQMRSALSPAVFRPTYGRFVLDWPDEHGLVRQIVTLEYAYVRLP